MANCKIVKINSIKIPQTSVKNSSLVSNLEKIINKLKLRIEREIPDRGFFRNFAENLEEKEKTTFWGKDIALFVERDAKHDGHAYLGVSVLHPTMALESSTYFMNGDRKKILEYISQDKFKKELSDTIMALVENLKQV